MQRRSEGPGRLGKVRFTPSSTWRTALGYAIAAKDSESRLPSRYVSYVWGCNCFHIDKVLARRVLCLTTWGVIVKRLRWIAILGLSFVSLVSIIPRVDAPETAFDETDTPVNLTIPLVVRAVFRVPAGHSSGIPRTQRVWCKPGTTMNRTTLKPMDRGGSRSLLNFLCTLLC
jgi:hypothetical protein